jgi:hypothetical protein
VKGPAGYGRYDDDPGYVGCPWARTSRSRCVARDGQEGLTGGCTQLCAGCFNTVEDLIEELAEAYSPARALLPGGDPVRMATEFAVAVREATEPAVKGEGHGGLRRR